MTLEQFMSRCVPVGACIEWGGTIAPNGYGRISTGKTKREAAHRVSWRLHGHPDPGDLDLCHTCDNRKCVNPAHLFAGTRSDNMRDAREKGRLRTPNNKGALSHRAKLSEHDVVLIRQARAAGESQKSVAARYGVDPSLVGQIHRRKIWRHLP